MNNLGKKASIAFGLSLAVSACSFTQSGGKIVSTGTSITHNAGSSPNGASASHKQMTNGSALPAGKVPAPSTTTTSVPYQVPQALRALVDPPLPGEGIWQPAGRSTTKGPVLYTTFLRPAAGQSDVGVAWINSDATTLQLYAGTSQPGGTWPYQSDISPASQPSLVAAFNGGFQFNLGEGGWYEAGRIGAPLIAGDASLVIFSNGKATIGQWGRDVGPGPKVSAVRQNLTLLVDNGAPTPAVNASVFPTWGATLGGVTYTWRSGLGVDANGNLIYVGGPGLDPQLLASTLVDAGAVRAMELDINPEWVSFASFVPSSAASEPVGMNLLPGMYFAANHYFSPFWRDFVAVNLRR